MSGSRDGLACVQWLLMKWRNVGRRTLAPQTEHPKKGTLFVSVEDVSDDQEILLDIVVFVMSEASH